jgi:hypothetical protein
MRMRISRWAVVLALIAVVALPGCSPRKSQHIRIQKRWNAKVKEAADLLASVTDEAGARAAESKLAATLRELDRINDELEKFEDQEVITGEKDPLLQAVGEGIAETQRLNMETLRISKEPELVAALGPTWKQLPSVFMLEAAGAISRPK